VALNIPPTVGEKVGPVKPYILLNTTGGRPGGGEGVKNLHGLA
jgi:hypothetical protein